MRAHARMVSSKDYLYIQNNRPQGSNPGPADSNASESFSDLKAQREKGKLNPVQADVFASPRPHEEFYLLHEDPGQWLNRAATKENELALDHLRQVLGQWMRETDDSVPQNLTRDWYDKETGKPLDIERSRGTMPGGPGALITTEKGPF